MSFINGIFLFATAAATIPVLLHLVRRMKARPMPFPSLMFLRATSQELVRRRRLKDLLLMATRAAMLALLAFVFARPFIPAEQLPFVPQRQAESLVLLVDRSFSMRYDGAFDRAVSAALLRVESAQPEDEIALIAFDDAAELLVPLGTDRTALRGALGALEPSFSSTDYLPALQRGADLLAEARHRRRVVVLASDFQESGWARAPADWKLPPGTAFEPLAVATDDPSNAYVEAFRHSDRRVEGRNAVRYEARVAAFGAAAERERAATLTIDGREADQGELPARASAPLSFEQFSPRDGYFQGALTLTGDDLPDDDRFFFTHLSNAPPSLLVVDEPSQGGRSGAFFLRTAFDLGDASRYRFARANEVSASALRQADVAFVSISAASAGTFRDYLENGGTVILSPSDADAAASFARLVRDLGAGTVGEIVDAREEQGYEAIVGQVDLRHPIFAPFERSAVLLRPRFRRYARVEPAEGSIVIGRFDTGDAFLLERRVGRGRLLVYTSTFNAAWTDLPLDEMYVPFAYQLAEYGSQRAQEELIYTVGDAVSLRGEPGERWEVRAPGGDLFRVTMNDQGRGIFEETRVPGQYAAVAGRAARLFSVNVDPVESNLQPRNAEEVYATVTVPASNEQGTAQHATTAVDDERNQKLWRILLLLVIGLFALETWLANRDAKKAKDAPLDLRKAA